MATTASAAGQSVQEFRWRVMLPVALVTLGAVLLAAFGLYWATTRSDTISIERQTREMRNAIASSVEELVQSQRGVAVWPEGVVELRKPNPDWHWVDDNMAFWLHSVFDHHQFYILNAQDAPIYAMNDGVRVEPGRYNRIHAASRRLVDIVRGRSVAPASSPDYPAGLRFHPWRAGKYGQEPLYASDVMSLIGRPAVVSVMRSVPLSDEIEVQPGNEPLIVSVRFLDLNFLQQLSMRNLIERPRFSNASEPEPGEQMLPLISKNGLVIGHIFWRPDLPGTKVMQALAPITAITTGVMALIMGLLARWLLWSRRQQQATLDELNTALIELKASEAQAQRLAFHDVLTGLPNRALFNDKLDQTLAAAQPATVLLLDLDRFKHVNDTLGHAAGDALIREFGARLAEIVRASDLVARLGGDEFAILCAGIRSSTDIEALCGRILEAVRRPFNLLGSHVFVGVSVGVSISCNCSDRVELMRKADIALYRAKADGRDCSRVFTPSMDDSVKLRGTIEEELRAALATGEGLVVHYQPQIACLSGAMVGLEALVRWQHPTRGLISPQQFIGVAEETGLICRLGEWVLQEACAVSRRWPGLFVAVNFSPTQFRSPGFAERVLEIVHESGADPRSIELEVTESVLLDDGNLVRDALERLRGAGFRIALDDFGTGYSSLSYLRRFEVDKIKIDRSFVQPLWQSVDAAAIVTAVLTLGHAMGLTVTAEGVETAEQHHFLEAAGCDMMQGYLFSPAVPEARIAEMLAAAPARTRGAA
jgi:diguanylate cyclase (GGDEF)-like protein